VRRGVGVAGLVELDLPARPVSGACHEMPP
jgi:hypothetical protein